MTGDFALINTHFGLLRTFSSAYMSGSLAALLLFLFASALLIGFVLKIVSDNELAPLVVARRELLESFSFSRKPILDWLAFHVNSPAVL
jgi:hypothetical protein